MNPLISCISCLSLLFVFLFTTTNSQTLSLRSVRQWNGDNSILFFSDLKSSGVTLFVGKRYTFSFSNTQSWIISAFSLTAHGTNALKGGLSTGIIKPDITRGFGYDDKFGTYIDVHNKILVAGAPNQPRNINRGAVYIYVGPGPAETVSRVVNPQSLWKFALKVNGTTTNGKFGQGVGVFQNTIAVRDGLHSVLMYTYTSVSNVVVPSGVIENRDIVLKSTLIMRDEFIFLSGQRNSNNENVVSVYSRLGLSTICVVKGTTSSFGKSIGFGAVNGRRKFFVVGEWQNEQAFVYEIVRDSSLQYQCVLRQQLRGGNRDDQFGWSVDIGDDGQWIAVGAPNGTQNADGLVYVYAINQLDVDWWTQRQVLQGRGSRQMGISVLVMPILKAVLARGRFRAGSIWMFKTGGMTRFPSRAPTMSPTKSLCSSNTGQIPAECEEVVPPNTVINATVEKARIIVQPVSVNSSVIVSVKVLDPAKVETSNVPSPSIQIAVVLSAIDIRVTIASKNNTQTNVHKLPLSNKIVIEFNLKQYNPNLNTLCVSKDNLTNTSWTTAGCSTQLSSIDGNTDVKCTCSHLTVFAVVQTAREKMRSKLYHPTKENITASVIFGLLFSLMALISGFQLHRIRTSSKGPRDMPPRSEWNMICYDVEYHILVHVTVLVQSIFEFFSLMFLVWLVPVHDVPVQVFIAFVTIPYLFYFWMYFFIVGSWLTVALVATVMSNDQKRTLYRSTFGFCIAMSLLVLLAIILSALDEKDVANGAVVYGSFVLSFISLAVACSFAYGCHLLIKKLKEHEQRMKKLGTEVVSDKKNDTICRVGITTSIIVMCQVIDSIASMLVGFHVLNVTRFDDFLALRWVGLTAMIVSMATLMWLYARSVDRSSRPCGEYCHVRDKVPTWALNLTSNSPVGTPKSTDQGSTFTSTSHEAKSSNGVSEGTMGTMESTTTE